MKQEFFKVAERRLWNEMVREGEIDRAALEDVKTPGEMMVAAAEILAISLSELEARRRLDAALHARVLSGVLTCLSQEQREAVEHGLRTWTLKDLSP
ncbi:MAG TPA: hypothetical protein VE981_12305 [Planctomycetota bacterium]|nr:hypothetical protein [Planctomycetota bacterium]